MTLANSQDAPSAPEELRIAIVTDAAPPQVNGVVRTLKQLGKELEGLGHKVMYVTPDMFRTIPLPTYKEIRIALGAKRRVAALLEDFRPDAIHIATEGPLGLAARRYCLKNGRSFTTSFHTRFPEYLHARFRVPEKWTYALVRRFHAPASAVMAATPLLISELEGRGFKNLRLWSRGVDTNLFKPRHESKAGTTENGPLWLYVGRVAVEKNIDAFLDLDLPGTKKVVGEGPRLDLLKKKYQTTKFSGALFGEELARTYAEADCFVFPSKTDTFGLVLIEALASGTPVAAYPVQGPLDVIGDAPVGRLDDDLKTACLAALDADPGTCRDYAMNFSWEACSRQFLSNLSIKSEGIEAKTSNDTAPAFAAN
ncbi:glycosyltransferase family 1 protein [Parvibaculaceae bacterium PLY_AMNH_Bact1]|nr:glycosyltransferase family 1 protein [Parvibaculaceae bacterium PLY_AMNH_Bact1]